MRIPRSTGKSKMKKLSRIAIAVNSLQIFCAAVILLYAIFSKSFHIPEQAEIALVAIAACIVIWGAAVDIRDAGIMRRIEQQNDMLEEAYLQLEELNSTLRKQRHDFKNHLQVVYTLTEMQAYSDAQDYVKRIYADVQAVGSLIRTAVPAVNALLSAKAADCSERGIAFDADIQSAWEDMPVAGWEMCRIIGNLIDNAVDALAESHTQQPRIQIRISESLTCWRLEVENNGPQIPDAHRSSIFMPGFTTKSAGHGNGLSIVRDLVQAYGGEIALESEAQRTCFRCTFPRSEIQSEFDA